MTLPFDCVVAADEANGIGKNNDLPWPRLKEDLRWLRRLTTEGGRNAVIMGRRTWESVPSKMQPLPDRINVVVSRGEVALPPGVVLVHDLDAALEVPAAALFVIGGANLFTQAFAHPRLRYIYLTRIHATFDCDAFLPPLDQFELEATLAHHREHEIDFEMQKLRRRPGT